MRRKTHTYYMELRPISAISLEISWITKAMSFKNDELRGTLRALAYT